MIGASGQSGRAMSRLEVASVMALAVELRLPGLRRRLGGNGAPPRTAAWGDALRLVALIGLLNHATFAVISLGAALWANGRFPGVPPAPPETVYMLPIGRWQTVAAVANVAWPPAYLALLYGHRRAGRLLAVLAMATIVIASGQMFEPAGPFAVSDVAYVVFGALQVAALVAVHRDAPPVRRRPWLLALPAGIAVGACLMVVVLPADPRIFPLLDWPAVCSFMVVGAAVVHLARRGRDGASWSLALALLASAVLGLRLLTLADYVRAAPGAQRPTLLALGLVEAGAVVVAAALLATLAGRALRRLPKPARP